MTRQTTSIPLDSISLIMVLERERTSMLILELLATDGLHGLPLDKLWDLEYPQINSLHWMLLNKYDSSVSLKTQPLPQVSYIIEARFIELDKLC